MMSRIGDQRNQKPEYRNQKEKNLVTGYWLLVTGFTLMEMIIVLAIIAIVLGMSLPYFGRFTSGTQIRGATRQVSSILYTARSLAITHRKSYAVVFDTQEQEIRIQDESSGHAVEKRYHIPPPVHLEHPEGEDPVTFKDDKAVFTPTGGLDGETGTVWLRDKKGNSMSITVQQSTGRVKVGGE